MATPTVQALPPPPLKEAKRGSSFGALPSIAPGFREVAAFKGLPLAGVKKKKKQRENPRPTGVASANNSFSGAQG